MEEKILSQDTFRILVADDDTVIRILISSVCTLAFPNAHIDICEDGSQAAEKYMESKDSTPFDVIVTDMQMPHCDGLELARIIRQWDQNVPIILISGTPPDKKPSEFNDMITKGPGVADIAHVIARLLRL